MAKSTLDVTDVLEWFAIFARTLSMLEVKAMLASEIERRINGWLKKNAVKVDENTWKCKRCGDDLWGQGKRLPVHDAYSIFGTHAGGGKVQEVVFPYCRKCDGGIQHFADITCIDF